MVEFELKRCVHNLIKVVCFDVYICSSAGAHQLLLVIADVFANIFNGAGYGDWSANDADRCF